MKLKHIIISCVIGATSLIADSLKIENPYIRESIPGSENTAAFMTLVNNSDKAIIVTDAKSTIAKKVELHAHTMNQGIIKMSQVPSITVGPSSHTQLKPGGLHIMFLKLNRNITEGEKVNFTLTLSTGEVITVQAPVKSVKSSMKHKHHHHHGMKH